MENNWVLKEDELPNAYEEVEVLMNNGDTHREMIVRANSDNLEWSFFKDSAIKAWRKIGQ